MKNAKISLFSIAGIIITTATGAIAAPFSVTSGVFDSTKTDLGLSKIDGAETITVFTPSPTSDHYGNGVIMAGFKGKLYCQWQSSATDEDSEDTWVAYSVGDINSEGETYSETWSSPKSLAASISNGYRTSGGWVVYGDTLVAFVNEWPDSMSVKGGFAYYTQSADGVTWSDLKPVLMKDGTQMTAVFEQDPHLIGNRLVNAAHFQPGLLANPIYTDDLSGRTGWVRAKYINMEHSGTSSREMEPSLFVNKSGEIVMTFRDQNSTYMRLASVSRDNGESWSETELTNMPDSRAKQSAGNLPDSSAYLVGNPVTNKNRIPLSITLSSDGKTFTKAYNLRTESELPTIVYEGTAKRLGYHYPKTTRIGDYLYVAYATNKELIEYTRIPLSKICNYTPTTEIRDTIPTDTTKKTVTDTIVDTTQTFIHVAKHSFARISLSSHGILLGLPKGVSHFALYDINGEKVYSETWVTGGMVKSIETFAFPAGIYFASLTNGSHKIQRKISIK